MAIEYLARQQGDQQVLLNELLHRDPTQNEVRIIEKVIEKQGPERIIERVETVREVQKSARKEKPATPKQ